MFFAPALRTQRGYVPAARSFDRNFERFLNDSFFGNAFGGLRVEQDDKSWTLSLDLPGVTREELNIAVEDAVVRIETKADAKRQYKAAYELSQEIDTDTSEAKLENGVLTLKLGKKQPVSKARTLQVL